MNIEKPNIKVFSIIIMVVLVAILLTVLGGFLLQQQAILLRENGMGRSFNPMQPESAQSGPTGRLVLSTGIFLLLVGFGVLVLVLWVGRKRRTLVNPNLKF